jgi:hypothetical protein
MQEEWDLFKVEMIQDSRLKSQDYHNDMNHTNFTECLGEKFTVNILRGSLVLYDASCLTVQESKTPNSPPLRSKIRISGDIITLTLT